MDNKKLFHGMGKGIRLTLSYADLKNQILPIPPMEEQVAIVEYLERKVGEIDHFVELTEQRIERLRELKQAVISEAVTRGIDFSRSLRLKDVATFVSGYAFQSNTFNEETGIPVIRIGDIGETIDYDKCVKVSPSSDFINATVKKGDILIAMSGATFGKTCVVQSDTDAYINQRVGIIRSVYNPYLKYVVKTSTFLEYLITRNTSSAQPNVSSTDILEYRLLFPPVEEQEAIVEYIEERVGRIDRLVASYEEQLERVRELKQSIISEAVTGQVCLV